MTLMGHQRPRIVHQGSPVVGELGMEATEVAALAGLTLDDWQSWMLQNACSVVPDTQIWNKFTQRYEPKWANFEVVGVVPRQNGKGSLLEARTLAGLFTFGERLIIHTAHRFETSSEAFARVAGLIEDTPDLSRLLKPKSGILHTSGKEGIYLKSGQRALFRTRTGPGGRGLTADCIFMDECMYLGGEMMSALMPTLSARPNPQIWYTGSAGDVELGDCSQLGGLRHRAEKHEGKRLFFAEWSINAHNEFCDSTCTEHDDPTKPESWAKANPGLGIRISEEYIQGEMESFYSTGNVAGFARERLSVGRYPVNGEAWRMIPKDSWMRRVDEASAIEGPFAIAVDTAPDEKYSAIAACGAALGDPELEHVEITGHDYGEGLILDHRPGTDWVVSRILEIWKAQKPKCVVIDAASPAGAFIDLLEREKVTVVKTNGRELAQACGEFRSSVCPREGETATLVHLGQPSLTSALAEADKRVLLDLWAWSRRSSAGDISPLVAATLAKWGFKHAMPEEKSEPWVHFGDDWMDEED